MSEAEPGPVAAKNTDTHLWPQVSEDFYASRLFATVGDGIGIDVGGLVIVKPIREWHALAVAHHQDEQASLDAIAAAVHEGRFSEGKTQINYCPFDEEGSSGRQYCRRIAREVFKRFKVFARVAD